MQKNPVESKSVRLDKWLWAARFYKTHSIARDAVQSGKVEYNEQRSKAGKIVRFGGNKKSTQGFELKEGGGVEVKKKSLSSVLKPIP